jgi:opacity protein-like surface antigen
MRWFVQDAHARVLSGVWVAIVGFGIAVGGFAPEAEAYEQRSATFSIGAQGQIAGLTSAKGDYQVFEMDGLDGVGGGVSIRMRLAINRSSAVGINFEGQTFKRGLPDNVISEFEVAQNDTVESLQTTNVTADYYRYFWRRAKQTPYLVAGIGFYRPEIRFDEVQTSFPGSDLLFNLGGGVEHFFTRKVSLEFSYRAYLYSHSGGPSSASQVALGLRYYNLRGRGRR